jgi:hypothetical protein
MSTGTGDGQNGRFVELIRDPLRNSLVRGNWWGVRHGNPAWRVLVSSWAILEGQITIVLESPSHEKTGATGACALKLA